MDLFILVFIRVLLAILLNLYRVILIVISVEIIYFEGRCYCFFGGRELGIKRFVNYLNSLIKILVCGADDIILILYLYLFVLLDLFFISLG
jgi:hypothetical protein